eukprot:sb/3478266/
MTGYQPIRDQYYLIRSVPGAERESIAEGNLRNVGSVGGVISMIGNGSDSGVMGGGSSTAGSEGGGGCDGAGVVEVVVTSGSLICLSNTGSGSESSLARWIGM